MVEEKKEELSELSFLTDLKSKYSHQPTFLQAVEEMAISLKPLFKDPEKGDFYRRAFLAMAEPERTIKFRVSWMNDKGELRFNRGWRVEFSRCVFHFNMHSLLIKKGKILLK